MKVKILITTCILSLILLLILMYSNNIWSNKLLGTKPTQKASCIFKEELIDIGKTDFGRSVNAKFIIYNRGTNNLIIENVLPDCYCTVSNFSKSPISPNDSTYIILTYDALNIGPFQSSALISSNATNSPQMIFMRGYVE